MTLMNIFSPKLKIPIKVSHHEDIVEIKTAAGTILERDAEKCFLYSALLALKLSLLQKKLVLNKYPYLYKYFFSDSHIMSMYTLELLSFFSNFLQSYAAAV